METNNKKGKGLGKLTVLLIIALVIASFSACNGENVMGSLEKNTVFINVGSPLMLTDDQVSFLDPDDYRASVYKLGQKVYLPLAGVKGIFDKDIAYDEKTGEGVLQLKAGDQVFSKADKSLIEVGGKVLIDLTKLAKDALGNQVFVKGNLIAISKEAGEIDTKTIREAESKIGGATRAKSDDQLKKLMKKPFRFGTLALLRGLKGGGDDGVAEVADMDGGWDEGASASDDSGGNEAGEGSFSETNVQVEGIDEADVIKTDGKFIYYTGERGLVILKVEERGLSLASEIKLDTKKSVREIFLDGDKLVMLGDRYENIDDYKSYAYADVYDISDRSEPKLKKSHEMEGHYQSSRKKGDHVYLLTNNWGGFEGVPRPFYNDMPMVKDQGNHAVLDEPVALDIDRIMVLPELIQPGYVILSAINISDDSRTEVEAITAYGGNIYMSSNALYVASFDNEDTVIHKFVIDGMNVGYGGSGKVKGHLLNQFSMDESKGYLRIATTEWDRGNNLFVLDSSLNVVGSVKDFAMGERIYSARFMGDKGYVVTFKNVDPLFVFDLADPRNPVITGELKIPGFSNYLHPVGEDLILGIGMETNELVERYADGTEEVVGFREGGLKVSLFDVSDMGKPKEITNLVIGKAGSHSEANYNHKAVMVDASRKQVGFYAQVVRDKDWTDATNGALIINYDNRSLDQKAFLPIKTQQEDYSGGFYHNRLIYVGDKLFVFKESTVVTYDYENFEMISQLKIAL